MQAGRVKAFLLAFMTVKEWFFCIGRDSEITEPINRFPRTSPALLIKIYLMKVFFFFSYF